MTQIDADGGEKLERISRIGGLLSDSDGSFGCLWAVSSTAPPPGVLDRDYWQG